MKIIKLSYFISLFLATSILILAGCKGPKGVDGLQGPPGVDGNANVIYSEWLEMSEENWSDSFNFFSQLRREYSIDEPTINEDILNKGTVLVFMRNISGNASDLADTIFTLPSILHITKPTSQYLGVDLREGIIKIVFYDLDGGSDPGLIPSNLFEYRYIIIPAGTPVSKVMEFDVNEYLSVTEYYGIDP